MSRSGDASANRCAPRRDTRTKPRLKSDGPRSLTAAVALDGIRTRHPHLTEEQAPGALLRLIYGDELYEAAYVARGRIG